VGGFESTCASLECCPTRHYSRHALHCVPLHPKMHAMRLHSKPPSCLPSPRLSTHKTHLVAVDQPLVIPTPCPSRPTAHGWCCRVGCGSVCMVHVREASEARRSMMRPSEWGGLNGGLLGHRKPLPALPHSAATINTTSSRSCLCLCWWCVVCGQKGNTICFFPPLHHRAPLSSRPLSAAIVDPSTRVPLFH